MRWARISMILPAAIFASLAIISANSLCLGLWPGSEVFWFVEIELAEMFREIFEFLPVPIGDPIPAMIVFSAALRRCYVDWRRASPVGAAVLNCAVLILLGFTLTPEISVTTALLTTDYSPAIALRYGQVMAGSSVMNWALFYLSLLSCFAAHRAVLNLRSTVRPAFAAPKCWERGPTLPKRNGP
jgi:hypothetical protein